MKEISRNIEKSTNDHIEFWSQLSEKMPGKISFYFSIFILFFLLDLVKLYEIGN